MAYIDNPNGFRAVAQDLGKATPVRKARLATSQTIHFGDALIPSSGYLAIALNSSTVIAGVAIQSVTSVSDTPWIEYIPAYPGLLFYGQCSGTPTIANLFADCDLEGTTGIMEINEDATTYNAIVPIELWDKKEGYGANARLVFFWKTSVFNISA